MTLPPINVNLDAESTAILSNYGFFIYNNCYYSYNKKGNLIQWSNFIMKPSVHVIGQGNNLNIRLFEICNCYGKRMMIELKSEDLVSLRRFKKMCAEQGNYNWQTSEENLTKLKLYLYDNIKEAKQVKQLGYQREGVFVFGNGVFDTSWHEADEMGVARTESGNYYLPAFSKLHMNDDSYQYERKFIHRNFSSVPFNDFASMFLKVHGENAMIGIGFLLATLFKDIVFRECNGFPILNVSGETGSGKTQFGSTLMSWFIATHEPLRLNKLTIPQLLKKTAQCSNALVHIDECKNNCKPDKIIALKGIWCGNGYSRMKGKRAETSAVDSGLILTGQKMLHEISIFPRVIFLENNRNIFTPEESREFNKLKEMCANGLTHLTLEMLRHRNKFELELHDSYISTSKEVEEVLGETWVDSRICKNWIIPLATIKCLKDVVNFPFTYKQMFDFSIIGITRQNSLNKKEIKGARIGQS